MCRVQLSKRSSQFLIGIECRLQKAIGVSCLRARISWMCGNAVYNTITPLNSGRDTHQGGGTSDLHFLVSSLMLSMSDLKSTDLDHERGQRWNGKFFRCCDEVPREKKIWSPIATISFAHLEHSPTWHTTNQNTQHNTAARSLATQRIFILTHFQTLQLLFPSSRCEYLTLLQFYDRYIEITGFERKINRRLKLN